MLRVHTYTHTHTHTYMHSTVLCCVRFYILKCVKSILYNGTIVIIPFLVPTLHSPLLRITSGSSWLYVEWNAQSATFRVLYRESGTPDYQVIVPTTSQLSHNISALQPNTLYNIVVEATHNVAYCDDKANSSVTTPYTTPNGEWKNVPVSTFDSGFMLIIWRHAFFLGVLGSSSSSFSPILPI